MKRTGIVILFSICAFVAHAQYVGSVLEAVDSLDDQPDIALEIINRAIDNNPDSEELLKVRADAYENLGQFDKAVADYLLLTQISPDDEILWFGLGRNQHLNGQLHDAKKSLDRATKLNPRLLPAYHTKTEILLQLNRSEDALKVSDSTLRIAETATTYFLQGEVYSSMQSWQRAEWAYSSAVKIDKGYIDAYIALAKIAANTNKATETLEAAESALAIDPDSEEALIARSRGLALEGDYLNAIEDATYVIGLNPNNAYVLYLRGTYYMSANRPREALGDFERALTFQPDNWRALAGRADAHAKTDNKNDAHEGYLHLLRIAANYPEKDAITQLAELQIFELFRENQPPVLVITEPEASENFEIYVSAYMQSIAIRGTVSDESPIKSLIINGQNIPVVFIGNDYEFAAIVALNNVNEIMIEVSDVYDNVNKKTYKLISTE